MTRTRLIKYGKNTAAVLAESVALLCLVILIAWGALIFRLLQGPMNIDYLTNYFEESFNAQKTGFLFDVGTTELSWGGRLDPFNVEFRDVRVLREDKTPVLLVKKAGVRLSKRHLLFLRVVPRAINIYTPALRLIRWEDGHVSLNIGQYPAEVEPVAPPAAGDEENTQDDVAAFAQELLGRLRDRVEAGVLGGLGEIAVSDARVLYQDKKLGVVWISEDADFLFRRKGAGGIQADIGMVFNAGDENRAIVRGAYRYQEKTGDSFLDINFSNVNPAKIAQDSEKLRDLSGVNIPLKGAVQAKLDDRLMPHNIRFVLGADPGTFNYAGFYKDDLPVENLYVFGAVDPAARTVRVDQMRIDFRDDISAEATLDITSGDTGHDIRLQAKLMHMQMDDLHHYWPEMLAPDPRAWVTTHLKKGTAHAATTDIALHYEGDIAAGFDADKIKLEKVEGEIDFSGLRVDYFPPMPAVTGVAGKAVYNQSTFDINVTGGTLRDMRVKNGRVVIRDMDIQTDTVHAHIDIDATVAGPVKTALAVLDSDPLGYPKALGIDAGTTRGQADVAVRFDFPLYKDLDLDEVNVAAEAKISDGHLAAVVSGMDLTQAALDLKLSDGVLSAKGSGRLATMPVTYDWSKDFSSKNIATNLTARITLDAAGMNQFDVPQALGVTGTIPAQVKYEERLDKTATLVFDGDLTAAEINMPAGYFKKPLNARGSVSFTGIFHNDVLRQLSKLNLVTDDIRLSGDVTLDAAGEVTRAEIPVLHIGRTRAQASAERAKASGYAVTVKGDVIDASIFMADEKEQQPRDRAAEKTTPLHITLQAKQLFTGADTGLTGVYLSAARNDRGRIDRIDLKAQAGGKDLSVRYMPQGRGRQLNVVAEDAGAALRAFDITRSVRGGRLTIQGTTPENAGLRDLLGRAILTDFTIRDAPVIAKLLNALSVPGILSLLSGQGLTFKKAQADFGWTDRSVPEHPENIRLIRLRDGKTSGASLGLMFEGSIDQWDDTLNIEGTIVPASDVSKAISVIPVVGHVLTAGGEGLIGANYTLRGPIDNPNVSVNPLSVLAPGILRKIFFD